MEMETPPEEFPSPPSSLELRLPPQGKEEWGWREKWNSAFEFCFEKFSHFLTRFYLQSIVFGVVVVFFCFFGLLLVDEPNSTIEIFLSPNSIEYDWDEFFNEYFGGLSRAVVAMITEKEAGKPNLLTTEHLAALSHIGRSLLDSSYENFQTFTTKSGVTITELDMCEAPQVPPYFTDPNSQELKEMSDVLAPMGGPLPDGFRIDRFPCNQISILDCFQEGDMDIPANLTYLNDRLCAIQRCIFPVPYRNKPSIYDPELDIGAYIAQEFDKIGRGQISNCSNWGGIPVAEGFVVGDVEREKESKNLLRIGYSRMGISNWNQDHPDFVAKYSPLGFDTTKKRERLVENFETFLMDNLFMGAYNEEEDSLFGPDEQFNNTQFLFTVAKSIDDVQNDQISTVRWDLIFLGYLIMLIYSVVCMGHLPFVTPYSYGRSRVAVVFAGIVMVGFSVLASFGLISFFGVKISGMQLAIIPFIGLGIGVDDIFIIMHTLSLVYSTSSFDDDAVSDAFEVHLDTPEKRRVKRVVVEAMRIAGPSVLLSSVSNLCAFITAAWAASVPQTSWFALQMVSVCVLNFITYSFIFIPLLYLDLNWEMDLFRSCRRLPTGNVPATNEVVEAPVEPSYSDYPFGEGKEGAEDDDSYPSPAAPPPSLDLPIDHGHILSQKKYSIENRAVLVVVFFIVVLCLFLSLYGASQVERKIDISKSMLDDSYQKDFFVPMLEYFQINSLSLVTETIDWPNEYPDVLTTLDLVSHSDGYVTEIPLETTSWLLRFINDVKYENRRRNFEEKREVLVLRKEEWGEREEEREDLIKRREEKMIVNGLVVFIGLICQDSRDVACLCTSEHVDGPCQVQIFLASDPSNVVTTDKYGTFSISVPPPLDGDDVVVLRLNILDTAAAAIDYQATLKYSPTGVHYHFEIVAETVAQNNFGLPFERSFAFYGLAIGGDRSGFSLVVADDVDSTGRDLSPIDIMYVSSETICSNWTSELEKTTTCGAFGVVKRDIPDDREREREREREVFWMNEEEEEEIEIERRQDSEDIIFDFEMVSSNLIDCSPITRAPLSPQIVLSPDYLTVGTSQCSPENLVCGTETCNSCSLCCDDFYSDVCGECHEAKCVEIYTPDCSLGTADSPCQECRRTLNPLSFSECTRCYTEKCPNVYSEGLIAKDLTHNTPTPPTDDTYPISPENFYRLLRIWLQGKGAPFSDDLSCVNGDGERQDCSLEGSVIGGSKMSYFLWGRAEDEIYVERLEDQKEMLSQTSSFPWDYTVIYTSQYDSIEANTAHLLFLCAILVSVVNLLFQSSWAISLLLFVNILFTALELYGLLFYMDLGLNSYSQVLLIMSVGMAVEFSVHLSRSFLLLPGSRPARAMGAIKEVGLPLFHGAISSFLSIFAILFNPIEWFRVYFFYYLSGVIFISFLNGIVLMPVVLAQLGPKRIRRFNSMMYQDDEADIPRFCL